MAATAPTRTRPPRPSTPSEAFEDEIDRALGAEVWVGPREPWYAL